MRLGATVRAAGWPVRLLLARYREFPPVCANATADVVRVLEAVLGRQHLKLRLQFCTFQQKLGIGRRRTDIGQSLRLRRATRRLRKNGSGQSNNEQTRCRKCEYR